MRKGLFITGTDTDVGKTYVTALVVKALREGGYDTGYYKAAVSGAPSIEESDAGFVNRFAQIEEPTDMLLSYLYHEAVSPHLAARKEGHPVKKEVIEKAWDRVTSAYPYVVVEGSGGIICPIRDDETATFFLEDIISWLGTPAVIVARAGLGSINHTVLTYEYMKQKGIAVKGILLNGWTGSEMEEDNVRMMERLTGIGVIGKIRQGDTTLAVPAENLANLFEEIHP